MKIPDAAGPPAAGEPMDDADFAILAGVRRMFAAADPMPADLPERIRFSLTLRDLEFEVARLAAEADQPMLTARGAEQCRTITFDSDSLTIMIRIESNQDGTARVDGWLAPAERRTVDWRAAAEVLTTQADDHGRFAFARLPRGSAQLVVRAEPGSAGSGAAVVTTPLIL